MKTILFQGDSITDCGKGDGLGRGYPLLVASHLGYEQPGAFSFVNRGVSGNRVVDVYARIKSDIVNLRPDCMSILIGVNDVWHEIASQNGVDADKFERIYGMLIEEVKAALPRTTIVIMEPFCLRGTATDDTEKMPDRWRRFSSEVKLRAEKAKAVADRYGLPFVPLQCLFDEAAAGSQNACWLADGVHPTEIGHELIKRAWIKAFAALNDRSLLPGAEG